MRQHFFVIALAFVALCSFANAQFAFPTVTSFPTVTATGVDGLTQLRSNLDDAWTNYEIKIKSGNLGDFLRTISNTITEMDRIRTSTSPQALSEFDVAAKQLRVDIVKTYLKRLSPVLTVSLVFQNVRLALASTPLISDQLIEESLKLVAGLIEGGRNSAMSRELTPDRPDVQVTVIDIIRNILTQNVLLPASAASANNVQEGTRLMSVILSSISETPAYLPLGSNFRFSFNADAQQFSQKVFDAYMARLQNPLAQDEKITVNVGQNTAFVDLAFNAFSESKEEFKAGEQKAADIRVWATSPHFLNEAVATGASKKLLSPMGVMIEATDTLGQVFNFRSISAGNAALVTLPYSLGIGNRNCVAPCRPTCVLWDNNLRDYTTSGVTTVKTTATSVQCDMASSGLVSIVGDVPPGERCQGAGDGDICVRYFVEDVPVTLETLPLYRETAMRDVAAALCTDEGSRRCDAARIEELRSELFGAEVLFEAGNAANRGFAIYFYIKKVENRVCNNCSPQQRDVFLTNTQAMYSSLRAQSSVPSSNLRGRPCSPSDSSVCVGQNSGFDSFARLCTVSELPTFVTADYCPGFEPEKFVDSDDDDTVMIVAIVGGCLAVVGAVSMYLYSRSKKAVTGAASPV